MRSELRLVAAALSAVVACAPAAEPDPAANGVPGEAVFPDTPPDGPMAEIGPAPDGYRPTAAGAPSTDIWIGSLVRDGDRLSASDLVNATDRPGYDNQPSFAPDGSAFYYVSAIDSTQTEVFRYTVATGANERLTTTLDASEFSPSPIPGQDAFSAIHEQRGWQHLWRYTADGAELGPLFATAEPVGYHAWANERLTAMFILGSPPTLLVGDAVSGSLSTLVENPGRSIHRIPGSGHISFVRKNGDGPWWIERLDPTSGQSERLVETLPGREDFAWTPQGEIIMGHGTSLHRWAPDGGWELIAELEPATGGDISRIAVSGDGTRIALVRDRVE